MRIINTLRSRLGTNLAGQTKPWPDDTSNDLVLPLPSSCLPLCLSWPFLLVSALCILRAVPHPRASTPSPPPSPCPSPSPPPQSQSPIHPSITHACLPCPGLYSTYCRYLLSTGVPPALPCTVLHVTVLYCPTPPHVLAVLLRCCMYFTVLHTLHSLHLLSIHTHASDCHACLKWIISQRTRKNIRPETQKLNNDPMATLHTRLCRSTAVPLTQSHPLTPHPLALSHSTHSHLCLL